MPEQLINTLKRRLYSEPPSLSLIEDAKSLINTYPRDLLPDWVEIIANGNPEAVAAVADVAKADIEAEA